MSDRNPLIVEIIKNYSDGNDDLVRLLALSVGRVLNNAYLRHEDWEDQYQNCDVGHIKDWLKAALVNNEPWLAHVDDKGRPLKLMKFSNLEQITQEADKAMMKANQKNRNIQIRPGEEELIEELADGYHIVRLLTPTALDREGAQMQHCIGQGAYDDDLDDYQKMFLSLRDPSGNPHATIELNVTSNFHSDFYAIEQLQGKQNKPPLIEYLTIMRPFLEKRATNFHSYVTNRGLVAATDGNFYHPHKIPENTTIHTFVYHGMKDLQLPKGLTVLGNFDVSRSAISALPDDIKLLGNVTISSTKFACLPDNLTIGGDLKYTFSRNAQLPAGLTVGRNLYLEVLDLPELPSDIKVKGDLLIRQIGTMKTIPDSVDIGGSIKVVSSAIQSFPDNMEIKRNLTLEKVAMNELPKGMVIHGNLDIHETHLKTLPADIQIKGNIQLPFHQQDNVLSLPEEIPDSTKVSYTRHFPSYRTLGNLRDEAKAKLEIDEEVQPKFSM